MNYRVKTQILLDFNLIEKIAEKKVKEKMFVGLEESFKLTPKGKKAFNSIDIALIMVEKYGFQIKDLI